jgi:plastocyanin
VRNTGQQDPPHPMASSANRLAPNRDALRGAVWSLAAVISSSMFVFYPLTAALAADAPAALVKMSDKPPQFMPEKVTIKAGQTVEWVNNAKTLHSVDGDPSMALKPSDVSLPSGAKPFDSGFMKPDTSWQYTFKLPGTYKYTCVPHEKDGMNGVVVVK